MDALAGACRGSPGRGRRSEGGQVIRAIDSYKDYLHLWHIVETQWDRIKAEANENFIYFKPLFKACGYRPLALLNAIAQAELFHHLDDEGSKQLAHAANTQQSQLPISAYSNLFSGTRKYISQFNIFT